MMIIEQYCTKIVSIGRHQIQYLAYALEGKTMKVAYVLERFPAKVAYDLERTLYLCCIVT